MPSDLRTLALTNAPAAPSIPATAGLRPILPRDRETLARIYRDSYPPDIGADGLETALAEIDQTFAGEFGELRPDASFLALVGSTPAGAVLVVARSIWDPGLPGPFVIDLFVAPPHRGIGVGRALMVAAIDACRAHADSRLSLRVGDGTSPAAHTLYATLGFTTA